MDIQYGKPAESVKRFSLIKWATAGILLALLLISGFIGGDPAVESSDSVDPGTNAATAAAGKGSSPAGRAGIAGTPVGGSTSLTLDVAPDGSLKVGGVVADEATRNQWLNAIRIGAQGARVSDELRIGPVAPAAAGWAGQLSSLVAVMRERQVARLRVDGDTVTVNAAVADPAEKGDLEKMIQAQLPPGYRMESKVGVASAPAATGRASASGAASSVAPAPRDTSVRQQDRESEKVAQRETRAAATEPGARTPARKPANCPRQLRSLAQSVYFKTDAETISAEDRARLQRLGECLGRARVRLVGYSDPRHTSDYNQELSERRARAVAEALAAGGAAPGRVSVVGAGQAKPASKGTSKQALQRSRRVDIQIR
jgi:outer membrane protein OmpA-like peptidoglycan-associated protein